MGWNNPEETVIGGTGQVYVGDPDTVTLPTAEDGALSPSQWKGLGFHSEDGVSTNQSVDIQRFGAWQTKRDIRRERDTETFQVTFALLQWDEDSVPLAFGGGQITTPSAGTYRYDPPTAADAIDEKALVADVIDGANILRFVVPRGTVVDAVDSQFTRSAMGMLPITFEALEPDDGGSAWYFLTNLAGFATGS